MRDPIAYTYDANVHCPECAHAAGMDPDDDRCVDSEGNPPGAIFPWDEVPPEGLYCGDCRGEIVAPTKPARMTNTVRIPMPLELRRELEIEARCEGMSLAAYCRRLLRDRRGDPADHCYAELMSCLAAALLRGMPRDWYVCAYYSRRSKWIGVHFDAAPCEPGAPCGDDVAVGSIPVHDTWCMDKWVREIFERTGATSSDAYVQDVYEEVSK